MILIVLFILVTVVQISILKAMAASDSYISLVLSSSSLLLPARTQKTR